MADVIRTADERGYIDWGMAICWTLIAICVACIPLAIYAAIQEQHEWNAFSAAHACRVIGHMEGSTSTGVGPSTGGNGGVAIVVTSIPGKIGYQCDDGQQYWRNE